MLKTECYPDEQYGMVGLFIDCEDDKLRDKFGSFYIEGLREVLPLGDLTAEPEFYFEMRYSC